MKLKTILFLVLAVVLLLVASVAALSRFRAFDITEPSGTQTPQPSTSAIPTIVPSHTPASQITPSSSPTPTQSTIPTAAATYKDVSYGTDPAQKFDVYIPQTSASQLPLIIFVHGGAWIAGDKRDVSPIANFLANQGFVVINMNYRLLPDFSYPAPMEDIQMVLQWIHQNSEQYKIDVAHIGMSGHSAGGHLIALYALTQDKNYIECGSALPRVYAIAPMAGGYTLEGINVMSERRNDTIMSWLETAEPQSLGLPIDQIDSSDDVSFLLLHGSLDVNSPPLQSTLFYGALVAQGVPAELKIYPGRTHLTLISGIPSNNEVAKDLVSFFNENLK